jgi:hypothetical protein
MFSNDDFKKSGGDFRIILAAEYFGGFNIRLSKQPQAIPELTPLLLIIAGMIGLAGLEGNKFSKKLTSL